MVVLTNAYKDCFERLKGIKETHPVLNLQTPLDIPHVIARNDIRREYRAIRMSKIGVILNCVCEIECDPKPVETIYLYGPELFGEKEAIMKSPYFTCFKQKWSNGEDETLGVSERILLNQEKLPDFTRRYEENSTIKEIVKTIERLSTDEIIQLSYDFVFDRSDPIGSIKTIGMEALSPVTINTICRNFSRARANNLFRDALIENPSGNVEIHDVENDLVGCKFPYRDCFKIGSSNNILTYHAIYFLNKVGRKANERSLPFLLASHYLREVCNLRKEKEKLRKNQNLSEEDKLQIVAPFEKEFKEISRPVVKNVRNSVDSLLDQKAISKTATTYHALGHIIKTPYGEATLSGEYDEKYSAALRNISSIHKLTLKWTHT